MDIDDSTAPAALPASGLLAVLGGCLVLAVAALAVPRLIAQPSTAALLGGGAAAALLLWLAALALGLRRAKPLWAFGGLAILLLVGIGAGTLADRRYSATGSQDASSFAETEFGPDGSIVLPQGVASRGPLSRRYAEAVTAQAQDRRAFMAEMARLNLAALNSPYELKRDPGALADCGRIGAVRSVLTKNREQEAARAAALVAAIDSANLAEALRGGMHKMVPGAGTASDRLLAADNETIDAAQALCQLLARRGWYDDGGYFGFRGGADAAAVRALTARRRKAAGDTEALQREVVARMTQGRDVVRDILSR